MGFAGMNSKCNTVRLVGRSEQLLDMLRLFLRNEFLLLLEMEASRYFMDPLFVILIAISAKILFLQDLFL